MAKQLRVLILEDKLRDAKLMAIELERAGFEVRWEQVDCEEDYRTQLESVPDVILADGSIPGFDAVRALDILKERGMNTPVIVVTGSVSDERAVEFMQHGAADYLLKDRLARLGQAVSQALEKKQLAENARRTEEERNRFFDLSLDLMCVAGFDGFFKLVNSAWETTLGWSGDELTARPYIDFVHPEDRPATRSEADRLAQGAVILSFDNRYRCKDGSYRWLSWRANPDPDRKVFYGVARDVTENKGLEAQLRQSQKMEAVGQLAGGVAHDFNNLLTIINGYGGLLLLNLPVGTPSREHVLEIIAAGDRAANLTRRLLAFTRQQVVAPTVLDLAEVTGGTEKWLKRLIGEDIVLRVVCEPPLWLVKMDSGQVEQVILNLAVNARDAMPTGGTLTIRTRNIDVRAGSVMPVPPGRYVLLTVADTGIGMDAGTKSRIFEPFFTTKGERGTGLGLATVYGIVKANGGHIDVESEPGRGTEFKVYFPVTTERRPTGKSSPGMIVMPSGKETVLLVEDEEAVRAFSRLVLQSCGYRLLEATNGREALELGERMRDPIHLLVTDVVMPEVGGRELVDGFLVLHPETRVLYVSGYTDDAVIRHGVRHAEVAFLQKPFSTFALAQKVREVLDQDRVEGMG
jgi:PAS domain S-box-containing protein